LVRFWLLSGTLENWKRSLGEDEHLWATRDSRVLRPIVHQVSTGDRLVFYATSPVSGIIGFGGVLSGRFTGTSPHWPDEKKAGEVLYPHRFKLAVINVLNEKEWTSKALRLDEAGLRAPIFRALNSIGEDLFNTMVKACEQKWGLEVASKIKEWKLFRPVPPPPEDEHRKIMNMIFEIGRLKGLVVEKEYPIDNLRIDVAWKRVAKGNPHAAFEVQIGGNFFEALTKLKHAWDTWRSVPILVTTDDYADKARQMVEGSFHEIHQQLRIIDPKDIGELHDAWKKIDEIETRTTLSQV